MVKKEVLVKALQLISESCAAAFKEKDSQEIYDYYIKKAELEISKQGR